eukprot:TRINITY_DN5138_c0_g1_i5.p1 TRINITY_DN5138_c0_g1~~TRINITY_DN5138_c0_g1_i5.p1  ORF type:complete len:382 (-),score=31.76 TRINITY_DN5138_c0_g1_i5:113-1258(-)
MFCLRSRVRSCVFMARCCFLAAYDCELVAANGVSLIFKPLKFFGFDDVIGLGLKGLALHPGLHFFGQIRNKKKLHPMFSSFTRRGEQSNPQLGHWSLAVLRTVAGNVALPLCADGSCIAIADTGTPILGVPHQAANTVVPQTLLKPNGIKSNAGEKLGCRSVSGPPLIMEGGFSIHDPIAASSRSVWNDQRRCSGVRKTQGLVSATVELMAVHIPMNADDSSQRRWSDSGGASYIFRVFTSLITRFAGADPALRPVFPVFPDVTGYCARLVQVILCCMLTKNFGLMLVSLLASSAVPGCLFGDCLHESSLMGLAISRSSGASATTLQTNRISYTFIPTLVDYFLRFHVAAERVMVFVVIFRGFIPTCLTIVAREHTGSGLI